MPLKADLAARGHLVEAGDARRHAQALPGPVVVVFVLVGHGGPRAHQAHVAAQHVEHLRHLVQAQLAQPTAHGGDARVVDDLEDLVAAAVLSKG
jgi:hypothetical protein